MPKLSKPREGQILKVILVQNIYLKQDVINLIVVRNEI